MSFTITTDVFCDFCTMWMDEGGATGLKVYKKEAWERAASFGWKKKNGKHQCPRCVMKEKYGLKKSKEKDGERAASDLSDL